MTELRHDKRGLATDVPMVHKPGVWENPHAP